MADVPAETLVTTPVVLIVATAGLELVQVPPAKPFDVKVDVVPKQRVVVPAIVPAFGNALTVMFVEVFAELPLAETV